MDTTEPAKANGKPYIPGRQRGKIPDDEWELIQAHRRGLAKQLADVEAAIKRDERELRDGGPNRGPAIFGYTRPIEQAQSRKPDTLILTTTSRSLPPAMQYQRYPVTGRKTAPTGPQTPLPQENGPIPWADSRLETVKTGPGTGWKSRDRGPLCLPGGRLKALPTHATTIWRPGRAGVVPREA
jgi:hypothetical protein